MSKTRTSKSTAKKQSKPSRTSAASGSSSKAETKTTEIRDLIDFIAKSGLNEVNIETQELKLHVKREPDQRIYKAPSAAAPAAVSPVAMGYQAPQQSATQVAPPSVPSSESSGGKTAE